MTTLLAFDPGGHTGYFIGEYTNEINTRSTWYGQLGPQTHHRALWNLMQQTLDEHPNLMIVAEDYRPEFARPQNYVALEYLGIMEAFAKLHLIPFERQDRGQKTTWTSEKLRKLGVWPKGLPHAQDAARHWLAYATKNASMQLSTQMLLRD